MTKLRETLKDVINNFVFVYTNYLGYQTIRESIQWLRIKLRYGKNPSYEDNFKKSSEIDNPQPSF
jgi:hypothetical protein